MTLTIRPLHPTLAAEVTGIDIAAGVDRATAMELEAASDRYPVLVLRGQNIDKEQQVAFAGLFGPLELMGRNLKGRQLHQQNPQAPCRHFQCRRRGQGLFGGGSTAAIGPRRFPVAHRFLVQGGAGEILDALWRPLAARRPHHRVRRSARGL
jgi:hypothetical protein